MTRVGSWCLTALLLAVVLTMTGCNKGAELNPDEFFTLEDFAQDQDYANVVIAMMNRWRESIDLAASHLGAAPGSIPFDERIPVGWSPLEGMDHAYISAAEGGNADTIIFDLDVTPPGDISPVKATLLRRNLAEVNAGAEFFRFLVGDSISVMYADGLRNVTELTGGGSYADFRVVFFANPAGVILNRAAGMSTVIYGTFEDLSSEVGNPQGSYNGTGTTLILTPDDFVTLDVQVQLSMRSNSRGEGRIWAKGEERARIHFERFDTEFHGNYQLKNDSFTQKMTF